MAADPQVVETEQGKVLVKSGAIMVRLTDETLKAKYTIPYPPLRRLRGFQKTWPLIISPVDAALTDETGCVIMFA